MNTGQVLGARVQVQVTAAGLLPALRIELNYCGIAVALRDRHGQVMGALSETAQGMRHGV